MYKRHITRIIQEALTDTPVILINGARQTGKSTLCQAILEEGDFQGKFVTMDNPTTLNAAQKDPLGFLEDLGNHVIIDEVQRIPELFLPIKLLVDKDRKNRRLILTGSADVMMMPKVGDSLAGRIEVHNLWPLSQDEIEARPSSFLKSVVSEGHRFKDSASSWSDIAQRIRIGGYPESLNRSSINRRSQWFIDYIDRILQKDIRELSNIEGLNEIPNILKLIAARIGSTVNMSDIARLSGVNHSTLGRYITLLEHIFLIRKIPAWTKNLEGSIVKSPKMYFNDTGLLANLIGKEDETFLQVRNEAGSYLENFVVMEIIKQLSWSNLRLKPYHFSIHRGAEVDLVLEAPQGSIYGIEIKTAASVSKSDFKGLRKLSELTGKKFKKGIVLYTGEHFFGGFGENMYAVPVSSIWSE